MTISALFFPVASAEGLGAPPKVGLPTSSLPEIILMIVNYGLVLVGVLALAYMVYGGFLYITSHGDSNQVDTAKNIIIYAVIGIVVIGVAAALVNFVVMGVLSAGGGE